MIPLDIFQQNMQDKFIDTILEVWLIFLSSDDPDRIIELITKYPQFKPLYETLYRMCQNVEEIMGFFSEELRIMDRNLTMYMMEEQQKELEETKKELEKKQRTITEKDIQIQMLMKQLEEYKKV